MRLLLITGIPGSGKTTVGNYLAWKHGFEHLDFERSSMLERFLGRGETSLRSELELLMRSGRDIVVTWGFLPGAQLSLVLLMRELGFEWIWFDGDRPAARRAFIARGTVSEAALDVQLRAIAQHVDLDKLQPQRLNTFDASGEFRPLDEIAAELMASSAR